MAFDPRGFGLAAKMVFLRAEGTGNSFVYLHAAAAHHLLWGAEVA
uniref:Uncharacterized protein n=1 Tax=Arundo donax TaxID=35708 RepID=A0A0A9EBE1_ARUDO